MKLALRILVSVYLAVPSVGATITIDEAGRGWYSSRVGANGLTPGNNYIVGLYSVPDRPASDPEEHRNYFTFSLPQFSGSVTSATLLLDVPSVNAAFSYRSADPTETFSIFGLPSAWAFNDIGSGSLFGNVILSAADIGTTVSITLNAQLVSLLTSQAHIHVGGAITSLGGDYTQGAFGTTGFSDSGARSRLELTGDFTV